jgi:hypothetical protein
MRRGYGGQSSRGPRPRNGGIKATPVGISKLWVLLNAVRCPAGVASAESPTLLESPL